MVWVKRRVIVKFLKHKTGMTWIGYIFFVLCGVQLCFREWVLFHHTYPLEFLLMDCDVEESTWTFVFLPLSMRMAAFVWNLSNKSKWWVCGWGDQVLCFSAHTSSCYFLGKADCSMPRNLMAIQPFSNSTGYKELLTNQWIKRKVVTHSL